MSKLQVIEDKSPPKKVCRCGHSKEKHYHGRGMCEAPEGGYVGLNVCQCRKFRKDRECDCRKAGVE